MTHQLNIFLLLFGAVQGWLLSLWFLRNQRKKLANLYFAFFLIAISLQLTFKVITKAWMMENVLLAYQMSYKMPYLIGPLLYLYLKARKNNTFQKTDLLHFVPFAFAFTYSLLSRFFPVLHNFQWTMYAQAFFQMVSVIAYGYFSLRLGNKKLKAFIKTIVAAEVVIIAVLALMVVYYGRFPDMRLLFLSLTVLVYWISYQSISKPDLFLQTESVQVISLGLSKTPKYAHSSLREEEAARIEKELNDVMKHQKIFLDSSLTIDTLSAKLKTTRHHLSQVINDKLGKTYGDYVCEWRLEESRKRLCDPANNRFTIAAIALDSGFSSVSSFNEVFKKRYGTTPSKFREQFLNKMSA